MVVPIWIKITETQPIDITIRAWRTITRGSHKRIGDEWFQEKFEKHFEPNAWSRYGYSPRTAKYLAYKRHLFRYGAKSKVNGLVLQLQGEGQDLVLTGTLSRLLAVTFEARGYPTRVTLKATTTVYAPMRARKTPDMIDEIFRLTPAELTDYTRRLGRYVAAGIRDVRGRRVTTIPSKRAA